MSDSADQDRAVQDPVCGKNVDPLRARAVGIYGGVTHYFCSVECKSRYVDPRQQESAPPPSVERRFQENEGEGEQTGNWFVAGAVQSQVQPQVEHFTDLEPPAEVMRPMPPSPSLLIEVAATKKRGAVWVWMLVAVAVVAVISVLGLRR
jgi:YHS domain-containing protein